MVPKTYVLNPGRMRLPEPSGGTEPIGNRIIVVPQDVDRVMARDPRIGFIAYVPPGSIAKGEALATTGGNGKTIACSICHGAGLKGVGEIPRLAGVHPTYLARQLYLIKMGPQQRHGCCTDEAGRGQSDRRRHRQLGRLYRVVAGELI